MYTFTHAACYECKVCTHVSTYALMLLYGICALNYAMQFVTDFITEGSLSLSIVSLTIVYFAL